MFSFRSRQGYSPQMPLQSMALLLCLLFAAGGSQLFSSADYSAANIASEASSKFPTTGSLSAIRVFCLLENAGGDSDCGDAASATAIRTFADGNFDSVLQYQQPERFIASRDRYRLPASREPPTA